MKLNASWSSGTCNSVNDNIELNEKTSAMGWVEDYLRPREICIDGRVFPMIPPTDNSDSRRHGAAETDARRQSEERGRHEAAVADGRTETPARVYHFSVTAVLLAFFLGYWARGLVVAFEAQEQFFQYRLRTAVMDTLHIKGRLSFFDLLAGEHEKQVIGAIEEAVGQCTSVIEAGGNLSVTGKHMIDLESNWRDIGIVAFMNSEPQNVHIQRFASQLLESNFTKTEADAKLLISAGAAHAMIAAMHTHKIDNEIQRNGIRFLGRSSYHAGGEIGRLVGLGAVQSTVKAMLNFPNDKHLQGSACNAIQNLAWGSKDTLDALNSCGGIPLMVQAMKTHLKDSVYLQEKCSKAFWHLVFKHKDIIQTLEKSGAVKAVVDAAEKYPENSNIANAKDFLLHCECQRFSFACQVAVGQRSQEASAAIGQWWS